MFELQPLYDRTAAAPRRAGDGRGGNPNLGYSVGKRALCVLGSGDPRAGQRQR